MKRNYLKLALCLGLAVFAVGMSKVNAKADAGVHVSYGTHVEDIGWMNPVSDNAVGGTTGQAKRMEAVNISLSDTSLGNIEYSTHVEDIGWMPYVTGGNFGGTTGQAKRLEAIKIRLTGELANQYDVYYSLHVADYGWLDYAKNGEVAGTEGQARRAEAIRIILVNKGQAVSFPTANPSISKTSVKYQAHCADYGWLSTTSDGRIAGTTGLAKRMEGLKISLSGSSVSGGVKYQAHCADIGWMNPVTDGALAGTTGEARQMEAVTIELTGKIANYYDIYYQAHIENLGWLGWAKNGEIAGSTGMGYRMEALKVWLVPKGMSPQSVIGESMPDCAAQAVPGEYRILVNKRCNVVTIYSGNVPIKAMVCSAGDPTPIGTFYMPYKARWNPLVGGVWGQYSCLITDQFLFHSVPYWAQDIYCMYPNAYNMLGTTVSLGCVRLLVADAKWIYDNCPVGTEITIYESDYPGPFGKPEVPPLPEGATYDPTDPLI